MPKGTKTIGALNGGWCAFKRAGLALLPVFVAANLTFTGWVAREQVQQGRDLAVIKSNRFTNMNGERLFAELSQKDLPKWLKDALERMEGRLERVETMLTTHMERHANGRTE